MLSPNPWPSLTRGLVWLLPAVWFCLVWLAQSRLRLRRAFRDGQRWARQHPQADLHPAILTAQARWPLRDAGQDPCFYAFLKGYHAARRQDRDALQTGLKP